MINLLLVFCCCTTNRAFQWIVFMNIESEVMIFSSYFHGETNNNKKETKNFY